MCTSLINISSLQKLTMDNMYDYNDFVCLLIDDADQSDMTTARGRSDKNDI